MGGLRIHSHHKSKNISRLLLHGKLQMEMIKGNFIVLLMAFPAFNSNCTIRVTCLAHRKCMLFLTGLWQVMRNRSEEHTSELQSR